jgi:hypothetical protein
MKTLQKDWLDIPASEHYGRTIALSLIVNINHKYTEESRPKRKCIKAYVSELTKDKVFLSIMKKEIGKL